MVDSPPTKSLIVLGMTWSEDGCLLRLRLPGEPSELVPAVGFELNYRTDANAPRHCVGHLSVKRNSGAYVDCLSPPQAKERTCVSCAIADAEFASDLHHAHTREREMIDQAMIDHLQQTNVLYLAAFRDGSIKVGTSTDTRKERRWTEQGAWRAVAVAKTTDGFNVRTLEDLATAELGLAQSVSVKRKLVGMANPMGDDQLMSRLSPFIEHVHGLIEDSAIDGVQPSEDVWSFPGATRDIWQGLHQYPARLDRGTHHVEVLEMCGRVAVLGRPASTDRFVADLAPLYGLELDLGRYEPDELAVQDSLF